MEVAYTNCLANNLSIFASKTPVFNSSTPSGYPSADRKPYYSGGLSLNESIDPTSIGL